MIIVKQRIVLPELIFTQLVLVAYETLERTAAYICITYIYQYIYRIKHYYPGSTGLLVVARRDTVCFSLLDLNQSCGV